MADLLASTNQNPNVSMNVSINGVNMFQNGDNVTPYIIGQTGATEVSYYNESNRQNRIFKKSMDNMLTDLLQSAFPDICSHQPQLIDAAIDFNDKVDNITINTKFDPDSLINVSKVLR